MYFVDVPHPKFILETGCRFPVNGLVLTQLDGLSRLLEGTAKMHVKAILTKLDAISRTEAVTVAHRRGLVHL